MNIVRSRGVPIRAAGPVLVNGRGINFIDLTGLRFGRLLVVSLYDSNGRTVRWLCKCDCGKETHTATANLRSGAALSCGCLGLEKRMAATTTHGHSNSPTYKSWLSMHSRCYDAGSVSFKWYGAKGIDVCDRWHKFENFLADMGERPAGQTIDRIKNHMGYCAENCRWSTATHQARHRRTSRMLPYRGETKTAAEWAEVLNINVNLIYGRVKPKGNNDSVIERAVSAHAAAAGALPSSTFVTTHKSSDRSGFSA
jgi:hypothetical protein